MCVLFILLLYFFVIGESRVMAVLVSDGGISSVSVMVTLCYSGVCIALSIMLLAVQDW